MRIDVLTCTCTAKTFFHTTLANRLLETEIIVSTYNFNCRCYCVHIRQRMGLFISTNVGCLTSELVSNDVSKWQYNTTHPTPGQRQAVDKGPRARISLIKRTQSDRQCTAQCAFSLCRHYGVQRQMSPQRGPKPEPNKIQQQLGLIHQLRTKQHTAITDRVMTA